MNMRKYLTGLVITALCAAVIFLSCGSAPETITAPDELDLSIREASDYLNSRIPQGSKTVFLNIQSDYPDLSEYILSDLSKNAVNDGVFSVVDRQQLDAIREELNFQLSGDVDDNSAQEIGKMLGAQTIVSGSVRKIGALYRLDIKAIEVQTAALQGQWNRNIPDGITIAALTENTAAAASGTAVSSSRTAAQAEPETQTYKAGDTGPAGGLIFYDKGNSQGGWRYLEAAPEETEKAIDFWVTPYTQNGSNRELLSQTTGRAVGDGLKNTQALVEDFDKNGGGFNTAVRYCADLQINGFDDWFVPSMDELNWMYGNLFLQGLGGLTNGWYWSSTTVSGYYRNYAKNFSTNGEAIFSEANQKRQSIRVRPVRRF